MASWARSALSDPPHAHPVHHDPQRRSHRRTNCTSRLTATPHTPPFGTTDPAFPRRAGHRPADHGCARDPYTRLPSPAAAQCRGRRYTCPSARQVLPAVLPAQGVRLADPRRARIRLCLQLLPSAQSRRGCDDPVQSIANSYDEEEHVAFRDADARLSRTVRGHQVHPHRKQYPYPRPHPHRPRQRQLGGNKKSEVRSQRSEFRNQKFARHCRSTEI